MIKSRTYYCNDCKSTIDFNPDDDEICKCGHIFGKARNDTTRDPNINMRNTPYGKSTKIEFTHRTLEESADKMRKDIHG